MRKKLLVMVTSIIICVGTIGAIAFASGTEKVQHPITEGTVDLDTTINSKLGNKANIYGGREGKKAADGGNFWVEWRGETHWALFDHSYKQHKTSCTNSKTTVQGRWVNSGERARSWIYSTLSGNKANWSTR